MSFEQVDFDRALRFEDRMLGSVDSAPHTTTDPAASEMVVRPNLSLVPDRIELAPESFEDDDQWQERGLCAQTDPEAFFPEKGGSTREAKRICQGCEVKDRCLEYALANDERFGIWGGLSERERRRLKRGII
jgi:WhiB family redox-sensing transcriptional regulator